MKICIPNKLNDIGGPSIFARKLAKGLIEKGIEITYDINDEFDIALILVSYSIKELRKLKKRNKKIVLRLDGVMTKACSWKYWFDNLKPRIIFKKYADYVIYQSEYSKYLVNNYFGENDTPYKLIYNGVDLNKFSNVGERIKKFNKNDLNLFTVSSFRREQQLKPMIESYKILKRRINNIKFYIAGPISDDINYLKEKKVAGLSFLGKVDNKSIPKYSRAADIFVFSTLNPPCPNAVIEALGCGLPIAGYETGAMEELVGENAGVLASNSYDNLDKFINGDPKLLADAIENIYKNLGYYKKQARLRAEEKFSIDFMVDKYIDAFKETLGLD